MKQSLGVNGLTKTNFSKYFKVKQQINSNFVKPLLHFIVLVFVYDIIHGKVVREGHSRGIFRVVRNGRSRHRLAARGRHRLNVELLNANMEL